MEQKSLDDLEFSKILKIIASYAGSNAAKDIINSLKPTDNVKEIRSKLEELEEYNEYAESGLKLSPAGLRDIREIMELMKSGSTVLAPEDFLCVKANIESAQNLKRSFESHKSDIRRGKINLLKERISGMPTLIGLKQRIDDCLDERGIIKSTASPTLSSIRREYSKTTSDTEKELNKFISQHSDDIQDSYFTVRNERYVIPVAAGAQSRIKGIVHDQSSTGQTVFIEPLCFLAVNNRLAQLRLSEREEIKRILSGLTAMLYQSQKALKEQFETLTWLDTLKAKADFASYYGAKLPFISEKGELMLHNARHPLLHPNCVPLDINLNKKQQCIIITGPNGGGKTVAMKTTGINALLMQTGNFVLADSDATLPVFSHVLSDIGESQSIENHLSTFTAHLKRLKEITETAGKNSLILIDEICVGTDPLEGGALASGFLKEICARGAYAVVTSHYDSLKNMAFTTEGFVNAAMEFDYDTFKPTFHFRLGVPGKSNALAMARSFGLPECILKDLVEVNSGEHKDEKGLIEAIERERTRAEALRRTYVQKITALRSKEQEIEKITVQLKEFRRTKRDKLTEEFTAALRSKLKEIEKIINRLKNTNNLKTDSEESKRLSEELAEAKGLHKSTRETIQSLKEAEEQDNRYIPDHNESDDPKFDFKAGDKVIWRQTLKTGVIVKIKPKNKAEIDFDGITMTVPTSELAKSTDISKKKKESGHVYSVPQRLRDEIDVRGMRAEEAIDQVESYLKQASDSDLGRVFIIHGKGTGALQRAITEFLKASPWKNKFRYGRYGEGDLGVTVVVFKSESDTYDTEPRRVIK